MNNNKTSLAKFSVLVLLPVIFGFIMADTWWGVPYAIFYLVLLLLVVRWRDGKQDKFSHGAFESAGVAMALIDKDQRIVKANEVCCDLLGYSENELMGMRVKKLLQRGGTQRESQCLAVFSGGVDRVEQRQMLAHKSGRSLWVRLTLAAVRGEAEKFSYAVAHIQDISQEYQLARDLTFNETHDGLTRLLNRYAFLSRLENVLDSAADLRQEHVLCYLDLDQFKLINDTLGHAAADHLLYQLGQLFKSKVRKSDFLARIGGDEFGILMFNCNIENARRTLSDLLQSIAEFQFLWQDRSYSIRASIGVTLIESSNRVATSTDLMKQSEIACYAAKQNGRNRIQVFRHDDEHLTQLHEEMLWIPQIQKALLDNQFVIYSQQIEATGGGQRRGHCELLLRYRRPDGEIVSPGEFLPAAERYNMSPAIDLWVVQQVLQTLQTALAEGKNVQGVYGVNLSGLSLGDPRFHDQVIQLIGDNQIPGVCICFEITETAVIANLPAALSFINNLRSFGCRFALDDFGSGLSSFAYLRQLPVDYLKIDGLFVKDCLTEPVNLAIINAVNEIAHVMDINTIAEFVESAEIFQKIRTMGVDYAQGYWHGRPVPWLIE